MQVYKNLCILFKVQYMAVLFGNESHMARNRLDIICQILLERDHFYEWNCQSQFGITI